MKEEVLLEKIINERKLITKRLEDLKKDSKVKRYIELTRELIKIDKQYEDVEYQNIINTCSSCNHLFAVTETEVDYYEGRSYHHFGCLKCGVDTHLYDNVFTNVEKAYSDYMRNTYLNPTNNSKLYLESYREFLDAREYYLKYKSKYKEVSDEELVRLVKEKLEEKKKVNKK